MPTAPTLQGSPSPSSLWALRLSQRGWKPAPPLQARPDHRTSTPWGSGWAQSEGAYSVSAFEARHMAPGTLIPWPVAAQKVTRL